MLTQNIFNFIAAALGCHWYKRLWSTPPREPEVKKILLQEVPKKVGPHVKEQ